MTTPSPANQSGWQWHPPFLLVQRRPESAPEYENVQSAPANHHVREYRGLPPPETPCRSNTGWLWPF
ncbi:unnamed protein product [Rotaria sordida]|uniref:Uncharacterized protein n=1 Tax=Rotaria sordida TaxID=392033 RepID=A0A813PQM1_9BILA|nr:unnamed protein product [Rotaria sordida]